MNEKERMFYMHSMFSKYAERNVWAKICNFQKSSFEHPKCHFGVWWESFFKIDTIHSPTAKSFLCVVWSYDCYQKIPWTLRKIFHIHNVLWKSIERNLRAKNETSGDFKKSFFGASKIGLWLLGSVISWKSTQFTLSCREIISTCRYVYEKCSLDSKESFGSNHRIIRHVKMISRQERVNFVDFQEIKPKSEFGCSKTLFSKLHEA